jgi:hypothetical protein
MAQQVSMDMSVPQSRQHRHACGRDHFSARWDGEGFHRTNGLYALTFDEHDTVIKRWAAKTVDQSATHQSY